MDVYHILSGLDGNAEQLYIYIYILAMDSIWMPYGHGKLGRLAYTFMSDSVGTLTLFGMIFYGYQCR